MRLGRVRRFQEPGGSAQSSSLLLEHQLSLAHGGSALLALVTAPPPCGGPAPCSGCGAAHLVLACPAWEGLTGLPVTQVTGQVLDAVLGKRPRGLVEAAHQGRHVLSVALQVGISASSAPPTSCSPGD